MIDESIYGQTEPGQIGLGGEMLPLSQQQRARRIYDPASRGMAEREGFVGRRDSGSMTEEFGRAFSGGIVDALRTVVSTGEELGLAQPRTLRAVESFQKMNRDLSVYEGAKPFSSWSGFAGFAGQGVASSLPIIAAGALTGGAASFVGASARVASIVARSAASAAVASRYYGDDLKYFRDEVGLDGPRGIVMALLSTTGKTGAQMILGAERRLVDVTTRGFGLNTLKRAGMDSAFRANLERGSREALIARVTGSTRQYFSTLKQLGYTVGGEAAAEVGELFVDDYMKRAFSGDGYSSFDDYFDVAMSVIPSTLMMGAFGAYRESRNRKLMDGLTQPITEEEVSVARETYGAEVMSKFIDNLDALRQDLLNMSTQMGRVTPEQAGASVDIIGGMALRSSMMIDRHDGKAVDPNEFVEGFKVALASRNITPDELLRLRSMPRDQQLDYLSEIGVVDVVEQLQKKSDAEDSRYVQMLLEKEMSVELDKIWDGTTESRMATWWRGQKEAVVMPEGAVVEEGQTAIEAPSAELQVVPEDMVNNLRVFNSPAVAPAGTEGVVVIPPNLLSREAKALAVTNPVVFREGEQFYSLRRLDNGTYGMVPTQALTTEQEAQARVERIKERNERIKASRPPQVQTEQAAVTEVEPGSLRDVQMYEGKIISPEVDAPTVGEARIRHAVEQAKVARKENLRKAVAHIDDTPIKTVKDLNDLPALMGLSEPEMRALLRGQNEETIERMKFKLQGLRRVRKFEQRAAQARPLSRMTEAQKDSIRRDLKSLDAIPDNLIVEGDTGVRAMTPQGDVEGLYLPSAQVAVFFENATAATILHEFFHHMYAKDLIPTNLKRALDKEFGDIQDPETKEERMTEAFTRYLTDGVLPDGADTRLAQAFEYMGLVGAYFYDQAKSRWNMPESVKTELDNLFSAAEPSLDQLAAGQAVLDGVEMDNGVRTMATEPSPRQFHTLRNKLAKELGITGEEMRTVLSDMGMKAYIKASDDHSGNQVGDMTVDDMAMAIEFMRERMANPWEISQAEKERIEKENKIGGPEQQAAAQRIAEHLSKMPRNPVNHEDRMGHRALLEDIKNRIARHVRTGRNFLYNYWNIAKVLDGGQDNGPFYQLVHRRIIDGENNKARILNEIEAKKNRLYDELGGKDAATDRSDMGGIVDVGGVSLRIGKVGFIYMATQGGDVNSKWASTLMQRNKEITPDVIKDAKKYVESEQGKKLRNYLTVIQSVFGDLGQGLRATAASIDIEMGDLGKWYVPFVSEDSFQAEENYRQLLDDINPIQAIPEPGARGVRRPGQIKSRKDLDSVRDEELRRIKEGELGRISLELEDVVARYVESSANYIAKAQNVKHMIQVLQNPAITDMAQATFGEVDTLKSLQKMVKRELYPSGRMERMGAGEKYAQYVRNYAHLSLLGYNVNTMYRQVPSFFMGVAEIAKSPQDIVNALGNLVRGMKYMPRTFKNEPLAGFDAYDEMVADHPRYRYRTFDPEHREMQQKGGFWGAMQKVGPFREGAPAGFMQKYVAGAMSHIRTIDIIVVSAVYKAAKTHQLALLQDRVARGEMTQAEAIDQAIDFAGRVIDKTQPPTGISQRNLAQTDSEWVKAMNPFSGQRMISFNWYINDVLVPIFSQTRQAQGLFGKGVALGQGVWNHKRHLAFGWVMPALMFGFIARRRMPEDEKEVVIDLLAYPFGMIPFIGRMAVSLVTGQHTDNAFDPTMWGVLARSVQGALDASKRLATGEEVDWWDLKNVARLGVMVTGTPEFPTRIILNFAEQAFKDDPVTRKEFMRLMGMGIAERERPDHISKELWKEFKKAQP